MKRKPAKRKAQSKNPFSKEAWSPKTQDQLLRLMGSVKLAAIAAKADCNLDAPLVVVK